MAVARAQADMQSVRRCTLLTCLTWKVIPAVVVVVVSEASHCHADETLSRREFQFRFRRAQQTTLRDLRRSVSTPHPPPLAPPLPLPLTPLHIPVSPTSLLPARTATTTTTDTISKGLVQFKAQRQFDFNKINTI